MSRAAALRKHGGVPPDLDINLLASMFDRDTLAQAVRDFRSALGNG